MANTFPFILLYKHFARQITNWNWGSKWLQSVTDRVLWSITEHIEDLCHFPSGPQVHSETGHGTARGQADYTAERGRGPAGERERKGCRNVGLVLRNSNEWDKMWHSLLHQWISPFLISFCYLFPLSSLCMCKDWSPEVCSFFWSQGCLSWMDFIFLTERLCTLWYCRKTSFIWAYNNFFF